MILIERQQASHWYLRDGTPYHEVPKLDNTGMRPVTLRDARRVGALPSVTNILNVLAKPGLEAWRIEQGIMAALTLPRGQGEPLDAFARRVVTDMGEQVERASGLGTAIHACCELYAAERVLPTDPALLALFQPVAEWFDQNVVAVRSVETVVVNAGVGYGGRVDLLAKVVGHGWCVVDFKTQKVHRSPKGEPRPNFYETWPLQLAAYAEPLRDVTGKDVDGLLSVVVDSTTPAPVQVKAWEGGVDEHMEVFRSVAKFWRWLKGYDPRVLP